MGSRGLENSASDGPRKSVCAAVVEISRFNKYMSGSLTEQELDMESCRGRLSWECSPR